MNLFKQRKNKRFTYTPRHLKNKDEEEKQHSLEAQWNDLKATNKRKSSFLTSPTFLVLFLIAVIVLMYVLGRYE